MDISYTIRPYNIGLGYWTALRPSLNCSVPFLLVVEYYVVKGFLHLS